MKKYRTTTLLLRPTERQQQALSRLLEYQCEIYNAALEERIGAWKWEHRPVRRLDQQASLTGWPQEFGVWPARGTLLRLERAFDGFFRRVGEGSTPGFPRFKSSRRWDSVEYPDDGCWKVRGDRTGRLHLQGIGHVSYRTSKRGIRGTPKTLVIRREGSHWRAYVVCEVVPSEFLMPVSAVVGLDVGITELAAKSDGELVENPRWFAQGTDRLAMAQRSLATKRRGSQRRRKAVERVGAAHRKIRNQRKDAHHKLSRRLVNDHDFIAHEKLQITNMTKRPKPRPNDEGGFDPNGAAAKAGLNREILSAGWGQLLRFIAYKAEEAGREVVAVNPQYTSQTCHECGHVDAANRAGVVFRCLSCGHEAHADINAAKNILRAGLALRLEREAQALRAEPEITDKARLLELVS